MLGRDVEVAAQQHADVAELQAQDDGVPVLGLADVPFEVPEHGLAAVLAVHRLRDRAEHLDRQLPAVLLLVEGLVARQPLVALAEHAEVVHRPVLAPFFPLVVPAL